MMKVAVYDTYITSKSGEQMHFDVVVEEGTKHEKVLEHGSEYLKRVGQEEQILGMTECQYCHSEQANPQIEAAIRAHGYHIVEMEGCR